MTKKDYVLIAETISKLHDRCTKSEVAVAFALALVNTNTRFDSARFIDACSLDGK